ncbi:hypothetical protein ACGFZH_00135 [Streptomyces zaomyceticus]|uniref:hypothetical protein n=1 Tax=Streptomyces zaomyceticus TaxID=68286 RepID=UPI0037194216
MRYGINPQQAAARAVPVDPERVPLRLLQGRPSYINLLDALISWQLVREASDLSRRSPARWTRPSGPPGSRSSPGCPSCRTARCRSGTTSTTPAGMG